MKAANAVFLAGALLGGQAAWAQYPSKPIRFVVPYAPGGAGDIFARTIGQKMSEYLGQQVLVDNRGGANGIIGTDIVAKAPPDGYTIVMGNSAPFVLNPSLYSRLPYDPVRDFAPVTQGTSYGYVLIVHPSMPVKSVADLVALARKQPGTMQFGTSGPGGANHVAGEFFKKTAGINIVHVPYKGSAPALADVVAGQITMMFDTPITTAPMRAANRVRALAVSSAKRMALFPDVPTMDELGYKGFEVSSWQGVLAPAGTPKPVIDKLHAAAVKALKQPDVVERLATKGGNELVANTPEEYAKRIGEEIRKYAKVIKEAGIRIN